MRTERGSNRHTLDSHLYCYIKCDKKKDENKKREPNGAPIANPWILYKYHITT